MNFVSTIKEENARSYNASINSPFIELLKCFETIHHKNVFVEKYLKAFEIGKNIEIEFNPKYQSILVSIIAFNNIKKDLVDYGYGIKQLVLILMQISVLANKNRREEVILDDDGEERLYVYYVPSLFVIEEPETNLHPKWQSLLGEMFAEASIDFNIQMIIETHSEYLIRKFQTLVAQKKLKSKDVKIIYLRGLDKVSEDKKQIENVIFNEDGSIDFKMFDDGFFDENFNLQLSLLNIRRDDFINEFKELKDIEKRSIEKITELENKIDDFIQKTDVSVYRGLINQQFNTTKLSERSVEYLVSGAFLLNNINDVSDFSPVVIQYGRAIENELKELFRLSEPNTNKSFAEMHKSLKESVKKLTGSSNNANTTFGNLERTIQNTFINVNNVKVGSLLKKLRLERNAAAHTGGVKNRENVLNYIKKANIFLISWISEKKG
ncbi:AAA family ATPase [Myroides odoratimimus]|uniref:AAA family ATPase n=1 Tax=Myroides odoratimimus TaxID=76832 RepID=UPI003D9C46C8